MGVKSKAGFIEAATWAAAYAQPTTLIPLKSESFTKSYDRLEDLSLTGQSAKKETFNGHQNVAGDLVFYLDYDNHALLKYAFGALSGGVYTHAELVECFNCEIEKVITRLRLNAVRINSLTITGDVSSSEPVTCTANCVAKTAARSATAFPALTETADRVWFKDITLFQIGDLADALGVGDALAIKSFEIMIENQLQTDAKDNSALNVLDPVWNDFVKFSLKLGIARISNTNADQLPVWKDADTRLQALLILANAGGESMTFAFPQMKITEGADYTVGGPGVIEGNVTLECYLNTANANMGSVTSPIQLTTT